MQANKPIQDSKLRVGPFKSCGDALTMSTVLRRLLIRCNEGYVVSYFAVDGVTHPFMISEFIDTLPINTVQKLRTVQVDSTTNLNFYKCSAAFKGPKKVYITDFNDEVFRFYGEPEAIMQVNAKQTVNVSLYLTKGCYQPTAEELDLSTAIATGIQNQIIAAAVAVNYTLYRKKHYLTISFEDCLQPKKATEEALDLLHKSLLHPDNYFTVKIC